ncbi:outer membrane lipoprotein carrier protein LolA [Chitinophaga sp. SYP-B3965]|uniref:LolA family protein n=1 Tax=Chitinophaga sp. SYP-B3965 TaxID=2663120 RepID=UPI001299F995|nr:outer membrane lipoprotein carrier protein LolA [Chitinophaga sp. SYP-B3965]MRG46040.1 outer membrane lipoprotein carrier protein LolA [Chitinophaga sp. SYP-B3965]
MRSWILLCCCFVALNTSAQTGFKPVANLEQFEQQFMKAAQTTNTIKSDFVQEKNLSMLSEKIVSKGKFWFKKENKVRMEYSAPSYYLMVINGKSFRIKDAKTDRNISTSGSKLFEQISKVTADCVQGNVLNNKDFVTKVLENTQYYQVQMTPVAKGLKDFFSSIDLLVEKKDLAVVKITMHERSGDDTNISFTQRELNVPISDEIFALK